MDIATIVCDSKQGHRTTVTCQFSGKVKTLARKASVTCPDTQIEAFYMADGNFVYIGSACGDFEFDASAFRLAMEIIRLNAEHNSFTRVFAVNLSHHGQIETATQMSADCGDISSPTIASDLNQAGHARSQVCNKVIGVLIITLVRQMRDNRIRLTDYVRFRVANKWLSEFKDWPGGRINSP